MTKNGVRTAERRNVCSASPCASAAPSSEHICAGRAPLVARARKFREPQRKENANNTLSETWSRFDVDVLIARCQRLCRDAFQLHNCALFHRQERPDQEAIGGAERAEHIFSYLWRAKCVIEKFKTNVIDLFVWREQVWPSAAEASR